MLSKDIIDLIEVIKKDMSVELSEGGFHIVKEL